MAWASYQLSTNLSNVRCELFTAMLVQIEVFRVVSPHSIVSRPTQAYTGLPTLPRNMPHPSSGLKWVRLDVVEDGWICFRPEKGWLPAPRSNWSWLGSTSPPILVALISQSSWAPWPDSSTFPMEPFEVLALLTSTLKMETGCFSDTYRNTRCKNLEDHTTRSVNWFKAKRG